MEINSVNQVASVNYVKVDRLSNPLTDQQNVVLGIVAAVIEGAILQPTVYWKNSMQQKLPFVWDPRIVYRGSAASIVNECQTMALQFGLTSFFQRNLNQLVIQDHNPMYSNDILAAAIGGGLSGILTSPIEMVMIQQQIHGGSAIETSRRLIKQFGFGRRGILRSLELGFFRESMYVVGMLGITPSLQCYLMSKYKMSETTSGLYASIIGGIFSAIPSAPFDIMKTVMQGDMEQQVYTTSRQTFNILYSQGGWRRFYYGNTWRLVNITGTVWIVNECRIRLPPFLFPSAYKKSQNN